MQAYPKSGFIPWVLLGMLAAVDAQALTFTVNDIADLPDDSLQDGVCHTAANTCTLRAAVMQANVTGGASVTISLPAGTFGLLRPVLGADGDNEGDLNLQSPAGLLTIAGAGAAQTIIDGNGLYRLFAIAAAHSVTISGMSLRNGYAGFGGAIYAGNDTLVVSDCVFDHNTAATGGAIAQTTGSLAVIKTMFSDNMATGGSGGAVYFSGSSASNLNLTLTSDAFAGNTASGDGGAVEVQAAGLIAADTRFMNNHSTANGGAVSIDGGLGGSLASSQASRGTFDGNTATQGGGAIRLTNSILMLDRSTVSNNSAGSGGGISSTNFGMLSATSSTFAGNHATGSGAGVMLDGTSQSTFASSTIAYNDAGAGGGIDTLGTLKLRNTLVAANTIAGTGLPSDCAASGSGTLHVNGGNLFTSAASISSCPMTIEAAGSFGYVNDLATLATLQDNGGPTQTLALNNGSNAIDAGDSLAGCVDDNLQPITTDQRGLARAVGLRCDIGAFEYGADSLFAGSFESAAKLVINEVDYDQVGTDTAEFIEIRNNGPGPASLAGIAVVLVNGQGGSEYARIDLSGAMELAEGAYLVVHTANVTVPQSAKSILFPGSSDQIQNGSPDGIALIQTSQPALLDALAYEGAITAAQIVGFSAPVSLVEGTPLAVGVADSNAIDGSLGRFPDGSDSNDANSDFSFRTTPTPGAANQ